MYYNVILFYTKVNKIIHYKTRAFHTATAEAMLIHSQSPNNKPAILAALDRADNALKAVQVAQTAHKNAFDHRRAVAAQAIIVSFEVLSDELVSSNRLAELEEVD